MILCATCLDPIDDDHPGIIFVVRVGMLPVPSTISLHNGGTCRLTWFTKYPETTWTVLDRIGA